MREVSVIGRPDREWGEVVVAYVVGEAKPVELDALCLTRIARFKRPKDYVFVDALPKNNYGKILKTELRARDSENIGRKKDRRGMNEIDKSLKAVCPICGKSTDFAHKPFCSKRCADIDLNRWLSPASTRSPAKEDEDEDGDRPRDGEADET